MEKNKGGRPPIEKPKTKARQIRFTDEQDRYIEDQANNEGVTFSEYVRSRALPKRLQ